MINATFSSHFTVVARVSVRAGTCDAVIFSDTPILTVDRFNLKEI